MKKLALLAAAGFALAGCAGSKSASGPAPAPQHYPIVAHSPLVTGILRTPGRAVRLGFAPQLVSPTRLAITTWGSGSCPAVPDELVVRSPHAIQIHLTFGSWTRKGIAAHGPPSGVCTADRTTTHMLVAIDPKKVDVHHSLNVRLFYYKSKKPQVSTAAPLNG